MKVNVTGRGFIPGVNSIAPVYNQDLAENDIRRILNIPTLRVFDATSGGIITKKNVNTIFDSKKNVNEIRVDNPNTPSVDDIVAIKETTVVETSEVETTTPVETVEETVETIVDETAEEETETVDEGVETTEEVAVEEDAVEEEVVADEEVIETTEEETAATEERPAYNNNYKKNKKNRNR